MRRSSLLATLFVGSSLGGACDSEVVADPGTRMIPRDGGSMPSDAAEPQADAQGPEVFADAGVAQDASAEPDSGTPPPPTTGDLRVNIIGLSSTTGLLAWGLFDESRAGEFSDGDPMQGDWIEIPSRNFPLEFSELEPGNYALIVYHDANANRTLDKGIFGQPIEDWGSTNNVTHPFSGPTFSESAVEVVAGFLTETDLVIHD